MFLDHWKMQQRLDQSDRETQNRAICCSYTQAWQTASLATHTHTQTHTHTHAYVRAYIHTYTCIHAYMHTLGYCRELEAGESTMQPSPISK